jgi:hypothetical protein
MRWIRFSVFFPILLFVAVFFFFFFFGSSDVTSFPLLILQVKRSEISGVKFSLRKDEALSSVAVGTGKTKRDLRNTTQRDLKINSSVWRFFFFFLVLDLVLVYA